MRLQADTRRTLRHGILPPALQAGQSLSAPTSGRSATAFAVHWAASADDVRDAQRLRYRVFVHEVGARLTTPKGTPAGLDVDRFDAFCDHLLVRAPADAFNRRGPVVGTYRVLRPEAARRAGGLYTDQEFDLSPLHRLRGRAVELGRSCVHPEWRSGGVIMALWSALAQYMQQHRLDTMIGCASIGIADGGALASGLWQRLRSTYLVAPQWQVRPYAPLATVEHDAMAMPDRAAGLPPDTPPLIKGYLRCGARLLGPPALDLAFNTADLPMMMRLEDLAPRYRRHLLGR
jgi:putative hemolysin